MARTATNVAGQALVPVIVSARNKILDRSIYDGRDTVVASAPERELVTA